MVNIKLAGSARRVWKPAIFSGRLEPEHRDLPHRGSGRPVEVAKGA